MAVVGNVAHGQAWLSMTVTVGVLLNSDMLMVFSCADYAASLATQKIAEHYHLMYTGGMFHLQSMWAKICTDCEQVAFRLQA